MTDEISAAGPVLSESSIVNLPAEDQPTPVLTPREEQENQAQPMGDHICYVCRRKLGSAEMLRKHEELSALHQKNLRIAKNLAHRKRHDLRGDVVRLRHLIDSGSPSVDRELKRLESELAHVQSDLELEVQSTGIYPIGDSRCSVHMSGLSWTGNKSSNEDRMCLNINMNEGKVRGCLIADGHCGEACADYLVAHLGKNVAEVYDSSGDIEKSLIEGFTKTDKDFLEYAIANEIPAGSTAIMCLFYASPGDSTNPVRCMMAHVGDSRGLVSSAPSGPVVRVTEDHKPDRPDEKVRLGTSGGHVVEVGGIWRVFTPNVVSIGGRTLQWGLAVSRAFGDLALKRPSPIVIADPEISHPIDLNHESVVVIACDGIFDVLSDEETMAEGRQGGPDAILRAAYGKLSDDNLTAIVCRLVMEDPERVEESDQQSLQRRPSVMSEPSGKKQRCRARTSDPPPEMIPPSQQIPLDN